MENNDTKLNKNNDILNHILSGKSNGEIAKLCNIEEKTVKWHANKIYKKQNVTSRSQLLAKSTIQLKSELDMALEKIKDLESTIENYKLEVKSYRDLLNEQVLEHSNELAMNILIKAAKYRGEI